MTPPPEPIQAVYVLREDGDWDFVAAFATDLLGPELTADSIADLRSSLEDAGEASKVVTFRSLDLVVDILTRPHP